MSVAAVLLLIAGAALGHICLISPPQRGGLSLKEPGDRTCFRRTPDCGGIAPEEPAHRFQGGRPGLFEFQQNLNHWNFAKPGFFDLALSYDINPTNSSWIPLQRIDDFPGNDMVLQTNFTVAINIPARLSSHAVIRIRYVSYNPLEIYPDNNTDAIFYNCADVEIIASTEDTHISSGVTNSPVGVVNHHIWYDAELQIVRWDRRGALWNETENEISLISKYNETSVTAGGPPEYVVYPTQNICYTYGADAFYAWQFGAQNGMRWTNNYSLPSGEQIMVFQNRGNGMIWEATSNCEPYAVRQTLVGQPSREIEVTFYHVEAATSPFPASVFQEPSYCHEASARHQTCRGNRIQ